MSVQSMTGFGRGEVSTSDYTVVVEIKSVNHRFRDLRFKMSSLFNPIENDFKKLLEEKFKRGSFDIYISLRRTDSSKKYDDLDDEKIKAYLDKVEKLTKGRNLQIELSPTELLRSEFYKENDEKQNEKIFDLSKDAFKGALDELEKARVLEGQKMSKVVQDHQKKFEGHFSKVEENVEVYQQNVKDKLLKRFDEFSKDLNIDEPRFLQEVVYYLEKLDVHEEINRIKSHLQKLNTFWSEKKEVGRQLDFLLQELNRETNTIGSKSGLQIISDAVVEMKVQLEKMREQSLNLQ